MTVSSEQSRVQYATDGVATSFPVPFRFLQNRDLRVTLVDSEGNEQELSLDTDYSVTGAGQQSGGTLTTTAAYPAGQTLLIDRIVSITQETAYQRNDPFPERAHERALDKLTMICQQLASIFGMTSLGGRRVLMVRDSDGGIGFLPLRRQRANHALGFDANGDPVAIPSDLPQLVDALGRAEAAAESAEEDAASASVDAATAAVDADRAEAAADAATLASGLYPDTNTIINGGEGFPPVEEGHFATTPSQYEDGFLDLYRVINRSSVYIDTYPNKSTVDAAIENAQLALGIAQNTQQRTRRASTVPTIDDWAHIVTDDLGRLFFGVTKGGKAVASEYSADVVVSKQLVSPEILTRVPTIKGWARATTDAEGRVIHGVTDKGEIKETINGRLVTVGVNISPEPPIESKSALASMRYALHCPLLDAKLCLIGSSTTWGVGADGAGPTEPRSSSLSDVRDVLTSGSWANQLRQVLGVSFVRAASTDQPVELAPGVGQYTGDVICDLYSLSDAVVFDEEGNERQKTPVTVTGASVPVVLRIPAGQRVVFDISGGAFDLVFGSHAAGGQFDVLEAGTVIASGSAAGATAWGNVLSAVTAGVRTCTIVVVNKSASHLDVECIKRTKVVRVSNQGIIGSGSRIWRPGGVLLDGAVRDDDTCVMVMIGSNDRGSSTEPNNPTRTYNWNRNIVQHLRDVRGVDVFLSAGQPSADALDAPTSSTYKYSQGEVFTTIKQLSADMECDFVDLYTHFRRLQIKGTGFWSDGLHLNQLGHDEMATQLLNTFLDY